MRYFLLLTMLVSACNAPAARRDSAKGESIQVPRQEIEARVESKGEEAMARLSKEVRSFVEMQESYQKEHACTPDSSDPVRDVFVYAYSQMRPRQYARAKGMSTAFDDASVKSEQASKAYIEQARVIRESPAHTAAELSQRGDACFSSEMISGVAELGSEAGKIDALQIIFQEDCIAGYLLGEKAMGSPQSHAEARCDEMRRLAIQAQIEGY